MYRCFNGEEGRGFSHSFPQSLKERFGEAGRRLLYETCKKFPKHVPDTAEIARFSSSVYVPDI